MIPILYEKTETSFAGDGIGRLVDCIKCTVTEERNGIYTCEFEYPVTGLHYSDITEGRIVGCTHDDSGQIQPFDICGRTEPINGVVTFKANHISYRQNEIVVAPYTASSAASAIANIKASASTVNPFTYWTDVASATPFINTAPVAAMSLLGGQEGSLLDTYGGEYEFDKFTVKLWAHRGEDTNVTIQYAKNLIDYEREIDFSGVYNGFVPYWTGMDEESDADLQVIGDPVKADQTLFNGRDIYVPLDLSDQFEEQPTKADLESFAAQHLTATQPWLPDQNITVNFVALWQVEEYRQLAPVAALRLCDRANIVVPIYGLTGTMKVVKTVFNVLADRYDEIELGKPQVTLAQTITQKTEEKVEKVAQATRRVSQIAGNTNQYFWHTQSGEDTGAHITEIPKAEFLVDPENGGPNLLLRSTGLAVRDGEKELAVYSSSLIALKDSDENVIFSVASASGAVRTFISWGYLVSAESPFSEKVDLGRSMDSLEDITVYYTVNGTAKTRTYSSLPVEDTPWSADPEESEDVSGYELAVEITQQDDRHLYFSISSDQSDVVLTKIIANFVTTQITAEMELGAFPDEAMSGPLKIGKGLSAAAPANALAIDWNGAGYFGGDDIRVGCNDDSTGGVSLYQGIRIDSVYNFDYVDGAHSFCDVSMTKVGRLVQLDIMIERDITTPVGTNMFSGSMPAEIPMPAMDWASGSNYYSRSVLHAMLAKNYNNEPPTLSLVIRNEGPETIAADALVHIPVVYIAEKEEANDESE